MRTKASLFFLVFALCANTCVTVYAQGVDEQDSLALVDLYNSTNGPGWNNNVNWLTGPVSRWHGIFVTDSRVTDINLNDNQLSGTIPTSIGNLVNLTSLSLSDNQLGDTIPTSIGNLVNLTYLNLFHNRLSGTIPTSIVNLVNLTDLYLAHNQLSGSIPDSIDNLVKLSGFILSNNQLSGGIPASIGNLEYLQFLNLSYNQLGGSIPTSIGNLVYLPELNLSHNRLSGEIPSSLVNLTNLYLLDLSYNQFTFEGMELSVQTFRDISTLIYNPQANIPLHQNNDSLSVSAGGTLSNNIYQWFRVGQPGSIAVTDDSVFLPLRQGEYYAAITNSICTNLILRTDTVYHSGILSAEEQDSLALIELYNSTNGEYWIDNTNWLNGPVATWYGITTSNGKVTEISLERNNLVGNIPSSLGDLVNLQELDLSQNKLSGSIPSSLGNLANLQSFDLSYNQLTFDGMELLVQSFTDISYSPQANILLHQRRNILSVSTGGTLSNNTYQWFMIDQPGSIAITGDSVFHPLQPGEYYATITNSICSELILHTDTIFYSGVFSVTEEDSLALVDLYNSTNGPNWDAQYNWLTGPVSTWYGIEVTNGRVTGIGLAFNRLKGIIPSSIGDLTGLKGLGAYSNQLNGNIPSSISNLVNLEYLNFGSNEFSGSVPSSINNLVNLKGLWLEANQLSGDILSSLVNLVNLQNLNLSINHFSGNMPSSFGNLVNLQELNLSENHFSGNIPSSFGNLVNLQSLDFSGNHFSGNIPSSFGNLLNLQSLKLRRNQLSGSIPSSLGDLANLQSLDLSHNQLTFDGMELLVQSFRDVSYSPQEANIPLHQNNNGLSVSAGGTLSNNTYQWFRAGQPGSISITGDSVFHPSQPGKYYAAITNSICTQLTLYTNAVFYGDFFPVNEQDSLALVALYNNTGGQNWPDHTNWLNGPVNTWYGITTSNGSVTEISLERNNLVGSIPPSLGDLVNLQELNLSENKLSGSIPSSLGNLVNLQSLDLSYNQLTFDGMELLVQTSGGIIYSPQANIPLHQNINSLSVSAGGTLSNNTYQWFMIGETGSVAITGDSVFHPSQPGEYYAAITSSICSELTLYTDTVFYGDVLPVNEQDSLALVALYNSTGGQDWVNNTNWLNGRVSTWYGITVSNGRVTEIRLEKNNLDDSIPSSLGDLANLKKLDLSKNKLSGSIPSSLGNLVNLQSLDLSYNQLTFDGMELLVQSFTDISYGPQATQANIPIHQNNNSLSVSAGGTLSNNTYRWFMIGGADSVAITGDSVFHPSQPGQYYAVITNSICTELTLHTDTVFYSGVLPVTSTIVYPNPAKNILNIRTNSAASFSLIHQSGKILLTKNIDISGAINVSGVAAGSYYLRNNSSGEIKKILITR